MIKTENLGEKEKALLDRLSPEDKEIIWGLVASPSSKKARSACRSALTNYLVKRFKSEINYFTRMFIYYDLLDLVINNGNSNSNTVKDTIVGEVEWLNCPKKDRAYAVMMAIRRLNGTMVFTKTAKTNEHEDSFEALYHQRGQESADEDDFPELVIYDLDDIPV